MELNHVQRSKCVNVQTFSLRFMIFFVCSIASKPLFHPVLLQVFKNQLLT